MWNSTLVRTILAAAFGVAAVSASAGAFAHDDHERWERDGFHRHRHHHYHEIVRERIIVREAPPVVYERPAYYRSPAIVIGVDVPPLVIPLR